MSKIQIAKIVGLSWTLTTCLGCGLFDSRDFQDKEDVAHALGEVFCGLAIRCQLETAALCVEGIVVTFCPASSTDCSVAPEETDEEIHACLEAFARAPCTIFDGAFIQPPEACLKFWSQGYYEE